MSCPDMTWEQYYTIMGRLREQKIKLNIMYFTGGEPTLWPHLGAAVEMAKEMNIAKTLLVVTNAVDRDLIDYGPADVVRVSHYGAVNRLDILRLKRQARWRKTKVRVQYVVQMPWPFDFESENNLPADCGCINMAFLGDKVYPCGLAAAREQGDTLDVQDDFYEKLVAGDPYNQELCRGCLSNRRNKVDHMAGLTAEFGVWDSSVGMVCGLKNKALWLRKLYRKVS
jgi:hypothetical protein